MQVYQVSEFISSFNDAVHSIFNEDTAAIEGEVAEFKVSQERFVWMKLKDEKGVIDCFAMRFRIRQEIEDGMKVRVYGVPKIFPRSGRFSVTVSKLEIVGEGSLKRAFELLKKKLFKEGLFAEERKRQIPRFPQRVGIITSRDAAAYTDFLRILENRWGGVEIHLAHVAVQGASAIREISGAFRWFNMSAENFDVLVLTRGGGSMEDLAAFNDEAIARSVFASKVPVVVGVGHERDETIADLVADVRASTPTNAAELVVPDRRDVDHVVTTHVRRISYEMDRTIMSNNQELRASLNRMESLLRKTTERITQVIHGFSLQWSRFQSEMRQKQMVVQMSARQMSMVMTGRIEFARQRMLAVMRLLRSLDPKTVLRRGYAIVFDKNKHILTDVKKVDAGAQITVQLASGTFDAEVSSSSTNQGVLPI